jgi:hypothetical protein
MFIRLYYVYLNPKCKVEVLVVVVLTPVTTSLSVNMPMVSSLPTTVIGDAGLGQECVSLLTQFSKAALRR